MRVDSESNKLYVNILNKMLNDFKNFTSEVEYSFNNILKRFKEVLNCKTEKYTVKLEEEELCNLVRNPHIIYEIKQKFSNFFVTVDLKDNNTNNKGNAYQTNFQIGQALINKLH